MITEQSLLLAWISSIEYLSKPIPLPNTSHAWRVATELLDPRRDSFPEHGNCDQTVMRALQLLEGAQLQEELLGWYFDSVDQAFDLVREDVMQGLQRWELHSSKDPQLVATLLDRIGYWMLRWQKPIEILWPTASPLFNYRRRFLSTLYAILPPSFALAITAYLRHLLLFPPPPIPSTNSSAPLAIPTLIALLDRYEPLLFSLIYQEIESKINTTCAGIFERPMLDDLVRWLNGEVMEWVCTFYERGTTGREGEGKEETRRILKPTFARFEFHVSKSLGALRTTELFDMIVDFPNSTPALKDLEICLQKTDQRTNLINLVIAQMKKRLLHPGVDTNFIIEAYISTIKALRILDPGGVLLSRVARPIRVYLRSREDTIKCIVSSLTEEGNELVEELSPVTGDESARYRQSMQVRDGGDEAETYNDPKWMPDPIDAPVDFRKSKGSDIIQSLVSIYDTKDVFIKELQVRLAQQLLAIRDYSLQREIKNIEILKFRFGEVSLQGCEVMIKDLQDSKRIDSVIQERNKLPLRATIVSRLFWPSFQLAPLKLPGQLGNIQSTYEKTFIHLKPYKRLRWLPQLGTINLTIELKDREITVDCTPVQASLIELFSQKDEWKVEDLVEELRMTDPAAVRNGLYFWNNEGVLKQLSGVKDGEGKEEEMWRLLEMRDESAEAGIAHVIEEAAPAVQSVEAEQVEQMRIFWQYIQGMLTNLKAMPISRIHSMLNMLVPSYKGRTTDQLEAFLGAMQVEGLVEKNGVDWKIVKL